jgi:hypothetical protein
MALSEDQRAMLQLLLEQGQSYEDIGSLLGLEVDEVRSRARSALTEMAGQDPDREIGLTDYLLGQADPIGRADVARHLQSDGNARELAERLTAQLRVLAPGANLPELPAARGRPQKPHREPAAHREQAPLAGRLGGLASTLSTRQRQMIAALLGGGVLVVVIVLIATGVFGGGGDGGGSSEGASSNQASSNASGLTRAVLQPQNGGNAQGVAVFARIRNTPVLQINVTGLKPTRGGQAYVLWLYGNDRRAFPLSREPLKKGKSLRGAAPIPNQVLQALQQGLFDSVDVSLSTDSAMTAALRVARKTRQLPRYSGDSVVRGPITGPGFSSGSGSTGGSAG